LEVIMGLSGFEKLKLKRAHGRVEATRPDMKAVEFRLHQRAAFSYAGEMRAGIVRRIDAAAVLVEDETRGAPRLFRFDRIEGQPL
jgi:hypothetical protein